MSSRARLATAIAPVSVPTAQMPMSARTIASSVRDEPKYLAFLGLYDLVFVLLAWGSFEYVVAET